MQRILFISFILLCLSVVFLQAQTSLGGKVIDEESKEPISFGTIALFKNGVLVTGTETDVEGYFNFPDMDPGLYDVEASYLGYTSRRITGVKVLAGKSTKLDIQLGSDGGVVLQEITIVEYKVPLIEQDNTTSGSVITSDQIRSLPTRNINALAATTAGLAAADEGKAITIRGSRSDATNYYIDGIRIQGNLIPESEIDQLQVITGGIEAQYGDVTGGIISITTKGPSNKFSGGVEVESSKYLDPYSNSLIGVNLSGPILKNKKGQSILGYRFSGRYTHQYEDNPPATSIYRVKEDKLAELEANPVTALGSSFIISADNLLADDVDILKARNNETNERLDLTGKIDARLGESIDMTLTGALTDAKNQFTPGGWGVLNSKNNPFSLGRTYRANFRLRQRFGSSGGAGSEKGAIQNASYTLQGGYEKTSGEQADQRHGFNYFDYGYVGKFDLEWVPTFALAFDPVSQGVAMQHTDYRQVLRKYTPGEQNPVLSNYNNALDINQGEGINPQVGKYILSNFFNSQNLLSLGNFIAPNGFISPVYNNSWGFHTNVGWVYNTAGRSTNDVYSFNARTNFDWIPGSSKNGRHNIQIGFIYEERLNRSYTVIPRGLWDIARQQANNHIQGIAPNADTIGYIDLPNFPKTPLRALSVVNSEDNKFYKSIREELGLPLTTFVNVDGLDPDQLRLDMFSAKELNDQNAISYFGHDYLGRPFDGTFEDFFTTVDENGVRTFPVAPNRPIYSAAYIQDKFTFRDIIFRLGVRMDRYDANTRVLKDPYSLYDIMEASEFHTLPETKSEKPGSIGDDYKVYLNDSGTDVLAYRDGDLWYRSNGNPVNSPIDIFSGGLVFPKYKDPRAQNINNYIKDRAFDPSVSFKDYEVQVNFMPRLAFSFPISDDANFFAHYDVLIQRPPSNTLATALDYFYFTDFPSVIRNNPDLRPERTIDYEVGFQQKLSATSKLKIAAYYKELRDMIQQRTYFPVPIVNQYTTYGNLDFGTVKGFSFEYEMRRTGNLSLVTNYTLQFADGTGSDANSQRGLTSRGNLRTLFPLNFDERHRVNMNIDYRFGAGKFYNGPNLFGSDILANAGLSLQAIAVSGRPYTATITPLELGGAQTAGSINGSRKPWNYTINLRVDKVVQVSKGLSMNIYCRVSNLLNQQNILNVYSSTGSPKDDGFLASSNGQDKLINIVNSNRMVDAYLASYQWALLNPGLFSLPRRIFAGVIMDF